jgi:hypothetical protein
LQSLDYIFWIQRGFNYEWNSFKSSPKKGGLETSSGHDNEEGPENKKQYQVRNRSANREGEKKEYEGKKLEIDVSKSKVEKFFFDDHHLVKQISDHYGVSAELSLL